MRETTMNWIRGLAVGVMLCGCGSESREAEEPAPEAAEAVPEAVAEEPATEVVAEESPEEAAPSEASPCEVAAAEQEAGHAALANELQGTPFDREAYLQRCNAQPPDRQRCMSTSYVEAHAEECAAAFPQAGGS